MDRIILEIIEIIEKIKHLDANLVKFIYLAIAFFIGVLYIWDSKIRKDSNRLAATALSLTTSILFKNKLWLLFYILMITINTIFLYSISKTRLDIVLFPVILTFSLLKRVYNSIGKNEKEVTFNDGLIFKEKIKLVVLYLLALHGLPTTIKGMISNDINIESIKEAILSLDLLNVSILILLAATASVLERRLLLSKHSFAKCETNYIRINFILGKGNEITLKRLHQMNKKCTHKVISAEKGSFILWKIIETNRNFNNIEVYLKEGIQLYCRLLKVTDNDATVVKYFQDILFFSNGSNSFIDLKNLVMEVNDESLEQYFDNYNFILDKLVLLPQNEKHMSIMNIFNRLKYGSDIEEILIEFGYLEYLTYDEKVKNYLELDTLLTKTFKYIEDNQFTNFYKFFNTLYPIRVFLEEMKDDFLELKKLGRVVEDMLSVSDTYKFLLDRNGKENADMITAKNLTECIERVSNCRISTKQKFSNTSYNTTSEQRSTAK